MTKITPAIMIGGLGTRLWPLSRNNQPKQFLKLFGQPSFFQDTLNRFSGEGYLPSWLMASHASSVHALRQLSDCKGEVAGLVLEPAMRGTAAAIAALALAVHGNNEDAVILVVPSDHRIENGQALHQAVQRAIPLAERGYIVTFGITPTAPETGFGYIRGGDALLDSENVAGFDIKQGGFLEKPDLETARRFVTEGYLWNAGIFLFRAKTMLQELGMYAPDTLAASEDAVARGLARRCKLTGRDSFSQLALDKDAFMRAPEDLPIDIAVLEKSSHVAVVPVHDLGWNDIGSLSALWDTGKKDENDNVVHGNVLALASTGNFVYSTTGRTLALSNTNDLVVVDTDDALLILPRNEAQSVKSVVKALKHQGDQTLTATRSRRFDWGAAKLISSDEFHRTLLISIDKGAVIPRRFLRLHQETWTLILGSARLASGKKGLVLKPGHAFGFDAANFIEIENTAQREIQFAVVQVGPGLENLADFGFSDIAVRAPNDMDSYFGHDDTQMAAHSALTPQP